MKKLLTLVATAVLTLSFSACKSDSAAPAQEAQAQDIRVFTTSNADGKITGATIEDAFTKAGFNVDGNNDMNKPFSKRFNSTWYKTYRLATVHHADLTAKLAAKYPSIGLLTPLSMSIWSSHDNKDMSISSLTLRGMSRITGIPMNNPDLIAYEQEMTKALKLALPGGHFEVRKYNKVADMNMTLASTFTTEFEIEEGGTIDEAKDTFEEEFEAEMEVNFLLPGFVGLNDELIERGVETFDFYDTYSVCKLEVIHPISKVHPEVGAFAPCTFFLYKKKGESEVHMGFPSVDNWITATDIEDEYSLKPLISAQNIFVQTLKDIIE